MTSATSWADGLSGSAYDEDFGTRGPASEAAVDLRFELRGMRLPVDHGLALAAAVLAQLPWLEDEPCAAIHGVRGAPLAEGGLGISRRARLVLRLPPHRVEAARALEGQALALATETVTVGPCKVWPVVASTTLYSRLVIEDADDEAAFAAAIANELNALDIPVRPILGRRKSIRTAAGECSGYSVLLHGMVPARSLVLQERGLGAHRLYGCGIMVPHKSIAPV